jgi:hypothetical protein
MALLDLLILLVLTSKLIFQTIVTVRYILGHNLHTTSTNVEHKIAP